MRNPQRNRRRILQIVGPALGLLLVVAAIVGISLYNYETTRTAVVALSIDLLHGQQRYVTHEVETYLAPAPASAILAQDMLSDPVTDAVPGMFMRYGQSMLAHVSQVDSFYLASDQGQFWEVSREGNGYAWTHLQRADGRLIYHHVLFDAAGRQTGTRDDPAPEGYDPRLRPWFRDALAAAAKAKEDGSALLWSDPYARPSTRQFIVTASAAFRTQDGHDAVFAINIALNQLTTFIDGLRIGRTGQAMIVDLQGHLVAGRAPGAVNASGRYDPESVTIDPKTQPVFVEALNHFRVQGPGAWPIRTKQDGQTVTYVATASRLSMVHRPWVLLIAAPQKDFFNFAMAARRQIFGFSLLVVFLATMLALALVLQARQLEHLRTLLDRLRARARAESAAVTEIAQEPDLFAPGHDAPILTEVLCAQTGARRASLWRLLPDGERLICEDSFDTAREAHSSGVEITRREQSALFDALAEGRSLVAADAAADPRTRNFERLIMRPAGNGALVLAPVARGQTPVGAIVLEYASERSMKAEGEEGAIVPVVAALVALRFSNAPEEARGELPDALRVPAPGTKPTRYAEGFLLDPRGEGPRGAGTGGGSPGGESGVPLSGVYPRVPVMVLSFADPQLTSRESAERALTVVSAIARDIQQIAVKAGLFSVQAVSNRLVVIGGCARRPDIEPDPGAALRLADAAVSIREACLSFLASVNLDPTFRVGLDVGALMAAELGDAPSVFNLWGEAVDVAELLAASAPDAGTIQVSEEAYGLLREHFLFRPRGMFYLPHSGVTRCFVLVGRR